MPTRNSALAGALLVSLPMLLSAATGSAQETWQRGADPRYPQREEAYRPDPPAADNSAGNAPSRGDGYPGNTYPPRFGSPATSPNDGYPPPRPGYARQRDMPFSTRVSTSVSATLRITRISAPV